MSRQICAELLEKMDFLDDPGWTRNVNQRAIFFDYPANVMHYIYYLARIDMTKIQQEEKPQLPPRKIRHIMNILAGYWNLPVHDIIGTKYVEVMPTHMRALMTEENERESVLTLRLLFIFNLAERQRTGEGTSYQKLINRTGNEAEEDCVGAEISAWDQESI